MATAGASAAVSRREQLVDGRYRKIEKVGQGTYGVVYKAEDVETGRLVALKKVRLDVAGSDQGVPSTTIREVSILKLARHRNVVDLLDVVASATDALQLHLVFEWLECDARVWIDRRRHGLKGAALRSVAKQLLEGIAFCHNHRIVHRDLKPQNLLCATAPYASESAPPVVKLADFGLARAFQVPLHTYTHEVVTLWYRAPEILLGVRTYTPAVDVWSAGCILAEFATKRALLPGDSEIDQLYKIFRLVGTPDDTTWPGVTTLKDYSARFPKWTGIGIAQACPGMEEGAVDLITRMLTLDPAQRITAADALAHPWLAGV